MTTISPRDRRPGETALSHLVREVPIGLPTDSVAHALARMAAEKPLSCDNVYVVDRDRTLLGVVPIDVLLQSPGALQLSNVMQKSPPSVHADADQEQVASRALKHRVISVPVVDDRGRLLGAVPPLALLLILRHEHVEDLHRLAGIRRETKSAREALQSPPARRARHRLPWLLAGLLGSTASALLMSRFETRLHAQVAIAFFIPAIVYLADAIGTQTEAIAVRGLSLTELPLGRMIWDEVKTGTLIGATLAALAFLGVLAALGDARLALAVSVSILAAGMTASAVGIGFPALLSRLDRDPAFGSGPIGTIVQDLLTLLIYFGVIAVVM